MPLSSRTCELSTDDAYAEVLTLSAAASRARTSPSPGKEQEFRGGQRVGFGGNLPESYAKWDRDSSSWKTCQLSFLTTTLESFSGSWPKWGLMLSGGVFQPEDLEPIFSEKDFSYVDGGLVPRPVAVDGKGSGRLRPERGANNNLRDYFNVNGGWMRPPVQASEYLMGLPINHTALDSAATEWFQTKASQRGKKSKTSQESK